MGAAPPFIVTGTKAANKAPVMAGATGSPAWTGVLTQAVLDTHAALTTTAHGGFKIGQATVASASAIAAPTGGGVVLLTGTTAVNTMTGGATGDVVTLVASGQATGVPVVLNHATGADNLNLVGGHNLGIYAQVPADTAASTGESVTFVKTATHWQELTRDLRVVLDYQQITANKSVTATTEAGADTVITATAITFDGATPIEVEGFSMATPAASTADASHVLYDGSSIGRFGYSYVPGAQVYMTLSARRRLTPTNAAHTYSWRSWGSSGTGTVFAGVGGSGANMPAYLKVSRSI